jgi:hypothetical protein
MSDVKLSSRDPRNRPAERKLILLEKVEVDRSTQCRERLSPDRVEFLADLLDRGRDFDAPIEVYWDGWKYWLADGFHRVKSYQKAGRVRVWALVREGTHRDALIHAAGANAEHGLPRTRKDVRRSILLLLDDAEFARLSDRTLARIVRCADKTVGAVRKELDLDTNVRTFTDRFGNVTEMDVSGQKDRQPRKPKKVDVPRSVADHRTLARSEYYEALAKAESPEELALVQGDVAHTVGDVAARRAAMGLPELPGWREFAAALVPGAGRRGFRRPGDGPRPTLPPPVPPPPPPVPG